MPMIPLYGCTPEPLGNYLKALGVFRIIAEQKDPHSRMLWRAGHAWLHCSITETDLIEYLINSYAPSPFLAVWGGRMPYFSDGNKDAKDRLERIFGLTHDRFRSVKIAHDILIGEFKKRGWDKTKEIKKDPELVQTLRNSWPLSAVQWLDATLALEPNSSIEGESKPSFGWLLGVAGSDGSADLTNIFWEMIEAIISKHQSNAWLAQSLFDKTSAGGIKTTAGQHFPRTTEAPNNGQFFKGQMLTNPWDFILMMEGCLLFAGAITKRLSILGIGKAAFPFMIDGASVGRDTLTLEDSKVKKGGSPLCRAEFWLPEWDSPISYVELRALMSDGRLQRYNGKAASFATEAMESIAGMGFDRGIHLFHRIGLYQRRGKGYYIATPLDQYNAPSTSSGLPQFLSQLDEFRKRLRTVQDEPNRLRQAVTRFENAIFEALRADIQTSHNFSAQHLHNVLLGIICCEQELATLPRFHEIIRPQSTMNKELLSLIGGAQRLNDGSIEYRLAVAIASLSAYDSSGENRLGSAGNSLRPYLLPVVRQGNDWAWAKNGHSFTAVWRGGNLLRNLTAVLDRRLIDASQSSDEGLPLWGEVQASFQDILSFWQGEVDETRIDELIHALALIRWGSYPEDQDEHIIQNQKSDNTPDLSPATLWVDDKGTVHTRWSHLDSRLRSEIEAAASLPRAYALLKLCFLGGRLPHRPIDGRLAERRDNEPYPPYAPEILKLLQANRAPEAMAIAARKLRALGYPSIIPKDAYHDLAMTGDECSRLSAMLLIPVRYPGILCALVIKPFKGE